jgi:hypothetical protein
MAVGACFFALRRPMISNVRQRGHDKSSTAGEFEKMETKQPTSSAVILSNPTPNTCTTPDHEKK